MYRHILAAINEHSNSEVAARYAASMAQACGARLSLVFVAPETMGLDLITPAEAALERLFREAVAQGLEVESIIQRGQPFAKISALVREKHIDLVFTATRREDVARRYFLKTLARELMLNLPCSVAVARVVHPGKISPQHILVPFRGHMTRLEERAAFVARLAAALGAEVTLFHAPKSLTGFFLGERRLKPAEGEASVPQDMEKFIEHLYQYGVSHEKRLGEGPVATAITVEAALRRNDLIIMGASERSLLQSMIAGNPVEQVLKDTPCNLMIFLPRLKHS